VVATVLTASAPAEGRQRATRVVAAGHHLAIGVSQGRRRRRSQLPQRYHAQPLVQAKHKNEQEVSQPSQVCTSMRTSTQLP